MTRVTFETAAIADVIQKADKIAPSKGKAFDKAAGIVIEVSPGDPLPVLVRSTNLDVYQMEWTDALEVTGDATEWRVPSRILAQVLSSLPIGSGKTVTFEQVQSGAFPHLLIKSGRMKSRFNLMDVDYYPTWDAFDPDDLVAVSDLGGRIAQVEWAAASSELPFSAVYLNGEQAIATDRYKLASAPLKMDTGNRNGILIPSGILGQVLNQTGEVMVGFDGNQLLLMPDEYTQIRTVIYDTDYPSISRITQRDYPESIKFKRANLIDVINRAIAFAGADRFPTLQIFFGKEEIAVMVANQEVGHLGDVIEVPGQATHPERVEIKFTPKNLVDAMNAAPSNEIELHYNPEKPNGIIYLEDGSGYEAWVMPKAGGGSTS